jgi:hypothetical protein
MSGNTDDTLHGLAKNLLAAGVFTLVALALPKPPKQAIDPTRRSDLVTDDERWTVEFITGDVLPNGKVLSEPAGYGNYEGGEEITCWSCGGTFRSNRLITSLVTYTMEPQYIHARHLCPSDACQLKTLSLCMSEKSLSLYFAAGYPTIKGGVTAPKYVRKSLNRSPSRKSSDLTPAQASGVQLDIYARALSGSIAQEYAKLLRQRPPKGQSA